MVKTKSELSWKYQDGETVFGAGDTTYLFGIAGKLQETPNPITSVKPIYQHDSRDYSERIRPPFSLQHKLQLLAINAIPWYWFLSQRSGDDPMTLKGVWNDDDEDGAAAEKFDLKTIALHLEKENGTTEKFEYYNGKCAGLEFNGGKDSGYWEYVLDMKYTKMLQTGLNTLSGTPALPATANMNLYKFENTTFTYNSNDIKGHNIQSCSIKAVQVINPQAIYRDTDQEWVKYLVEGPRQYAFSILGIFEDQTFQDDLVSGDQRTLVIKASRTATDYIEITLNKCDIISSRIIAPIQGDNDIEQVSGIAKFVNVEVYDGLTANTYYPIQS